MVIKILGGGCKKCEQLADNAKAAALELGIDVQFEKVTDFMEIAKFGVMSTPALVVDEKVVSYGKVLKPKDIAKILEKAEK